MQTVQQWLSDHFGSFFSHEVEEEPIQEEIIQEVVIHEEETPHNGKTLEELYDDEPLGI